MNNDYTYICNAGFLDIRISTCLIVIYPVGITVPHISYELIYVYNATKNYRHTYTSTNICSYI